VAGVLLAVGCAPGGKGTDASAALSVPVPSGWMGDTSKLGPSPYHPGTLFWQSPRLREYSRFYVDAVVVVPLTSVRGLEIDVATAEQLSTDLRDAVLEELGPAVVLVDEPGPGVATIRGAITKVARSRRGQGATSVGGAAMEVEIVDSVTRERLAAAIEAAGGGPVVRREARLCPLGSKAADVAGAGRRGVRDLLRGLGDEEEIQRRESYCIGPEDPEGELAQRRKVGRLDEKGALVWVGVWVWVWEWDVGY